MSTYRLCSPLNIYIYIYILVGGFKHDFYFLFHIIWDVILPIDELHDFFCATSPWRFLADAACHNGKTTLLLILHYDTLCIIMLFYVFIEYLCIMICIYIYNVDLYLSTYLYLYILRPVIFGGSTLDIFFLVTLGRARNLQHRSFRRCAGCSPFSPRPC